MRWIVVFTALLLASSAVPVLAADASGEKSPEEAQVEAGPVEPPDEHQVQEGIEAAEREEAAREHELQTPELTREREESRYAFANLSDADAQQLLLSVFSAQMASLNADPARYLSDVEVLRTYGESGATVSDEGDGSLLEAGIPFRTENEEGDLEKVDLSLQATETGFEPANPLVELHIPENAGEAIEIGEEGLAISAVGAEEESEGQALGEKNVWFSEAQADTDLMVSPTASGVELFDQLRSADSPETLRFQLDLPEGAELSRNGGGGADISQDGEVFAFVSPPSAVDAQGTPVPVELLAEGSTISIHVPHREGDFAYPILLDPVVTENYGTAWYYGTSTESLDIPGVWRYNTNDPTETWILHDTHCLHSTLCSPSGRGLFISTLDRNIPANVYAQWLYYVPGGTTYIPSIYEDYSAHLNPFWRRNNDCSWSAYPAPYDFDGAYDAAGNWTWFETDRAQWYGTATMFTKAKGIAFGMSSGGGVNIPCWRDIMVGGTVIRLDDPEAPTLSSVTGLPSGWVSDAAPLSITANVQDPGLGVQNVTMAPEGGLPVLYTPQQNQCPGTKTHPCPASRAAQFNVNADLFDEGEEGVKFSAYDPTGETSNTYFAQMRVDRTSPEVTLGGQLAVVTEEDEGDGKDPEKWDELNLPVYNLKIEATDGSNASPAQKRSGVKSIEVFLDSKGTPEKTWTQTCPGSSCAMTQVYTLNLNELTADVHHTLKVLVKDQVGKIRERNIEFEYIPATGMKDEYVMQYFPLPDGQGNEAEEEHPNRPELAVNVMNGNLVYREEDVEVTGSAVDLEVERYYNSLLPDSENTEWGDGWTLAQSPKLEPEETGGGSPSEATMVRTSGVLQSAVELPTETNGERFDAELHAVVTKEAGGYEVADASGETDTALAFDQNGRVAELRTPGYAKIDYSYEGGDLSEIAVDDPGSASATPEEVAEWKELGYTPLYTSSFGGEGSGAGQLSAPGGVATDSQGNVWVADTGHNRVQEFNSEGEFVRQFGAKGSGDGLFSEPRGIAVDGEGNVWVADTKNHRVQVFSPEGEYLSQFGSEGTGNGQLKAPAGLTTDAEGNVWVADTDNNRVQRFSPEGEYLSQFGSSGTENGQFKSPQGITLDSQGNVWVADTGNARVQEFAPEGKYLSKFGGEGSGDGQLKSPAGLTTDADGTVWVADTGNNRVQRFTPEGEYLSQFGTAGNDNGQFSEPKGIALDSEGNVWVADTNNNRVQESTASEFVRKFGGAGSGAGQLSAPGGVATDSQGNVWVADTGHNRVQEFNSEGEFVRQFGAKGSGSGLFSEPKGIATDAEGNVWVADTKNYRVQEFNPKGEFIRQFGSYGTGNGQFISPQGITVGPEGHLWIVDASPTKTRVQEFTAKGEYLSQFGSYGTGNGQFKSPQGITLDSEGNVWVADTNNNRVQKFNPEGEFIRKLGSEGSGDGQLKAPAGLTVDAEGTIWVADTGNNRVQRFSPEGEYLSQFGTAGNDNGQFSEPKGIALDSEGNVWVADTGNNRVQESTASEFVRKFGGAGSGAGQLSAPGGVATDSEGNVWVADTGHNRVQEFNSEGEFVRQFGAKGSGSGLFKSPQGIALDSEGTIWVADTGNNRVQRFTPEGEYLSQFGSSGTENGQFTFLRGIAVGPEGHLWTVESGFSLLSAQPRVQEFTAEGEYLSQFGSSGTGDGQFKSPQGIAVDLEGNLWVADTYNNRVQQFNPEGEFIRKLGSEGTGKGQLSKPFGLTTDADDTVWVADTGNNRVQRFTPEGEYLSQFGTAGNDNGQFSEPKGIALDSEGNVWVADTGNNRVQEWLMPGFALSYASTFGSSGSGDGQFKHPADVAPDFKGNLWVVDEYNYRVEKLSEAGEYLSKFGSYGTENGQFKRPTALALDTKDNIWVTDAGNNRVMKFNEKGEYLSKFGSAGSGNGQFSGPEGIAIDTKGNVWVSDTYNGRLQKFNEKGEFIKVVGSYGSGQGQLGEPTGIDIGSGGNVWVADWQNNRVSVFNEEGEFVRQFGSSGSGDGQFARPDALDVDPKGNIWVGDQNNGRVQRFNQRGEYIAQFGTKGSGEAQFSFGWPMGIATDSKGNIWVTDTGNNRVQRWQITDQAQEAEALLAAEDDPRVEIEVSNGLVDAVKGEEAGQTVYEHEGELLTAVDGAEGETSYEYDSEGRLTRVTLPNGTWGEVKYDPAYGRVAKVTVAPEGANPKSTYFEYSDEPRRTTVTPEGAPAVTYDIGADGSVLKWWNAEVPPDFDDLSGTLYFYKETAEPISTGDHNLVAQAHSEEGIASIEVIANGSNLVDERTCEQDYEEPGIECVTVINEWVVNTGNLAPGILNLEVIATDRLENTAGERFWVNIPYTPPPDPGAEERPRYEDILHFREEFGLDLDLKGDELAINDRIFNLIGDWYNPQTPEGEVARATMERWGVPLRAVDAAELEYRNTYIAMDGPKVEEWGETNAPSTYAGYYVDHRAGGLIYVGFTQSQASQVESLKNVLMASDRIRVFPEQPTSSVALLRSLEGEISNTSSITGKVSGMWIEIPTNRLVVNTPDLTFVSEVLTPQYGPAVVIREAPLPLAPPSEFSRHNATGPVQAGDHIEGGSHSCSAGFGAWDELPKQKPNEQSVHVAFILTAGHCFSKFQTVRRALGSSGILGEVRRNNYVEAPPTVPLDAEAIRTKWNLEPRYIYISPQKQKRVTHYVTPKPGQVVCASGSRSDRVRCGPVLDAPRDTLSLAADGVSIIHTIAIPVGAGVQRGDSGGPTWLMGTGEAVGLITASSQMEYGYPACTDLQGGPYDPTVDDNYDCPILGTTPIEEIIRGSGTLYNSLKLQEKGLPEVPPLPVRGVTVAK